MFSDNAFFISKIPVVQNAVKNVLFRGSALILNFVVYKFFAFLAFRLNDYTSFLMFAEDAIQKTFFLLDRKFNSQAILVLLFGVMSLGAGFYDTLIWGLDEPGYVLRTDRVSAGKLSREMLLNPAYIIFISNPTRNVRDINLQSTIGANLYASGLNFTLPGLVKLDKGEVVPPLQPLSPDVAPRIWLDDEGFAVGLDNTIMWNAGCSAANASITEEGYQVQGWACPVNNNYTAQIFQQPMGVPTVWWDLDHAEFYTPSRKDNQWFSLEKTGETAIMKQVFGVTKGLRKHWFVQTMWKATMLGLPTLDDDEITDLVRRTWSDDAGSADSIISDTMQMLVDYMLKAKEVGNGYLFGEIVQMNDTVRSMSAEFLIQKNPDSNVTSYQILRIVITQIMLLSSEILPQPPTPFAPCDMVYRNVATSGIVRSTNCNTAYLAENQTTIPPTGLFLGEIDTAAVVIMTDLLGDGQSSTSEGSLNQTGIDWYRTKAVQIDKLLLSRAAIVSSTRRSSVMVDVIRSEAAISYIQLLLILIPPFLFVLTFAITFLHSKSKSAQLMSYYENSFLVAVLATTHVSTEKCIDEVGYVRRMPEVGLKRMDGHVVLKTPFGGTIVNVVEENVGAMIFEPLIWKGKEVGERWEAGYE